jgi:arylsulfatase B
MKLSCTKSALYLLAIAVAVIPDPLPAQALPHNILLVLADDIGTDALSLFNTNTVNTSFASTPNLDALAAQSVRFRNCYGYPSCSPTRSCLLTGRYGFRTGIGAAIDDAHDPYLSPRDFTIAKALNANPQLGFHHAHLGKWHLSAAAIDPNLIGGWSHFFGFLAGELESYYDWEKTVDGVTTSHNTNYATSDNATDAINWISAQGTNRWFLWFAPKAAHAPLHKPPKELHSYDWLPEVPPANGALAQQYYMAMIEALDTEMGRVLTNVNLANTLVVFMADNGTPTETIQSPYTTNQCKGTLTEGGIRLPMFIAGAGVVGTNRWTDAVVHAVDVPVTLLEMAGVNLAATLPTNMVFDGRSFAAILRNEPWNPAENAILSENFGSIIPAPLRGVAARGQRYKVIELDSGLQGFYDLQTDPYEHANLLGIPNNPANLTAPQLTAYVGLTNRLNGWHNPPSATLITEAHMESGALSVSVPEQLGIAYSLVRSTSPGAPNWAVVTNFIRQVHTNDAVVTVTDPSPPSPAYYRAMAQGH